MCSKRLTIVLVWVTLCASYKILLVFPFPFKSHCILGEAFASVLVDAGHKVTHITSAAVADPHQNLRQIVVKPFNYKTLNLRGLSPSKRYQDVFDRTFNVTYSTIKDESVQKLMEDINQRFDLVIAEWMFNDLYSGLSAVFNCPYIWYFSTQFDYDILRLTNSVSNPWMISSNFVLPLNFIGRVRVLLQTLWSSARKYIYYESVESIAYKELFREAVAKRGRSLPSYENIRYNASFFISNSHYTVRDSLLTHKNHIAIGGYHITERPEALSQEILSIIENSNGIIVFSLGAFLKAEEMPNVVKRNLLDHFSKLNQTVFWKIDEHFDHLPQNVKTFAWIPIQSILAHHKCVLFISHGGMLSLTESVHYGVPVIGIPIYADQDANVKTIMKKGAAKMVLMSHDLADDLMEAINEILIDPRYKENMRALSSLYHDRVLPPRAELLHWVEHVATVRGNMLRPAVDLMPWYYSCCLDLTATLLLLFGLLLAINKLHAIIRTNIAFDKIDVMTRKRQ